MRFVKMQGIGNDYVYVDCFEQQVSQPAALARRIADRHFGVGGDGLILVMPSTVADVRMRMFNADGSEPEMCGNGVRCVAKLAWDHGRVCTNPMRVETGAGIKTIQVELDAAGKVTGASVDMGQPMLAPAQIPVNVPGERVIDAPLEAAGETFAMTCVSMGNPHAILYVKDIRTVPLEQWGPVIEKHPAFPRRVNVHFVQVLSRDEVMMCTWERGSGVTLACGTGASAVCVAGVLTGRGARKILAHLPGGDLTLEWRESDDHVTMTGPATEVFTGDWPD